jgi:hypothetical protein
MEEAAARHIRVTIRYFDGCPNWHTAYDRLRDVLREEGMTDVEPILERVETPEDAEQLRFIGSPTISSTVETLCGIGGDLRPDVPDLSDPTRACRVADAGTVPNGASHRLTHQ